MKRFQAASGRSGALGRLAGALNQWKAYSRKGILLEIELGLEDTESPPRLVALFRNESLYARNKDAGTAVTAQTPLLIREREDPGIHNPRSMLRLLQRLRVTVYKNSQR